MRIGIYARVSTQRQAQADGLTQQLERLQAHALQQGWDVAAEHIFRDDGYSGASLTRPGLERLRDQVAMRQLDGILITAPDRLARRNHHRVDRQPDAVARRGEVRHQPGVVGHAVRGHRGRNGRLLLNCNPWRCSLNYSSDRRMQFSIFSSQECWLL